MEINNIFNKYDEKVISNENKEDNIMSKVTNIKKYYEIAYKTERGEFHREICDEQEKEICIDNIEGDNCSLVYVQEADPDDIAVFIKISNSARLRYIIELATSELYNRLTKEELKQYED